MKANDESSQKALTIQFVLKSFFMTDSRAELLVIRKFSSYKKLIPLDIHGRYAIQFSQRCSFFCGCFSEA